MPKGRTFLAVIAIRVGALKELESASIRTTIHPQEGEAIREAETRSTKPPLRTRRNLTRLKSPRYFGGFF